MEQGIWNYDAQARFGKAKERGLTQIMITCNDDNLGSAKVMENNGIVLQDRIENIVYGKTIVTRRYVLDME